MERFTIPKMKGLHIKRVFEVLYLGIILDYGLNWIANLDARITKAITLASF